MSEYILPALSPMEETEYNQISMKIQRDINCLSEPDRHVRRRAVDKLHRFLQSSDVQNLSLRVLSLLYVNNFEHALFTCAANDSVEKCREKSLLMLVQFAERHVMQHSIRTFQRLVQLLHSRLGKIPYPETTEEIRLLLVQLLALYLLQVQDRNLNNTKAVDIETKEIGNLCDALGKAALDQFPDVKKVTADCSVLMANIWPQEVALQLALIVKPMVGNLSHQHSRVRIAALLSLEALIPCGNESLPALMKDVVIPAIEKVLFDRSAAVRAQLMQTLATWLQKIASSSDYDVHLCPLLLAGITDDSRDVCNAVLSHIHMLSEEKWEKEYITNDTNMEISNTDTTPSPVASPPFYFNERPPNGARALVSKRVDDMLKVILPRTCDWTVTVREKYTQILCVLLILLEDNVNPYLDILYVALAKICRDGEQSVKDGVHRCSHVLGQFADLQMILSSLLPMVAGRLVGQDTSQHRTNGLILLGMSIRGMLPQAIARYIDLITEALCDAGLRESENPELQNELGNVATSIIATLSSSSNKNILISDSIVPFRLFWILSYLVAMAHESSIAYDVASEGISDLAMHRDETVEQLHETYFGLILDTMDLSNLHDWNKNHPKRLLFDSICRRGGVACSTYMGRLVPVFLALTEPSVDADLRLAIIALLETLLGIDDLAPSFQPYSSTLMLKALLPHIVWQGGRVAATIRKVAIACIYTLLKQQNIADQASLYECAPQMLPVLKSCLDDTDAKTRQLVCLAMQYLFLSLPGKLGDEPVHQLYPEILKRLDDSNDIVRQTACQTFKTFLSAAPISAFKGTMIDYSLDCLFVHLDDSDPIIQQHVMEVIQATIVIDAELVIRKAHENRSRHQSPRYCDEIIAYAKTTSA